MVCLSDSILPCILQAGDDFIKGGNPFNTNECPKSPAPGTYLAVSLLAFVII